MKTAWREWFVVGVLLVTTAYVVAEELSLTTYYPSPKGAYQTLSSTDSSRFATYAGNVGIGTISPAATTKLEVKGAGNTSGSAGLHVTNSDGTSGLFVRDDGNVVIGGTTPAQTDTKLTVVGSLAGDRTFQVTTPQGRGIGIRPPKSESSLDPLDAPVITTNTSVGSGILMTGVIGGTNQLFLRDTGNVGIGTTDPGQALEVNAAMKLTPTSSTPILSAGTIWYDSGSNTFRLATGPTSWVVIAPRGVHLGVTATAYPGNLGLKDGAVAKCASAGFPDSHICSCGEVGSLPGGGTTDWGWCTPGNASDSCSGWQSSGSSGNGGMMQAYNNNFSLATCDSSHPIHCCR